jgi:hypothetical protein
MYAPGSGIFAGRIRGGVAQSNSPGSQILLSPDLFRPANLSLTKALLRFRTSESVYRIGLAQALGAMAENTHSAADGSP